MGTTGINGGRSPADGEAARGKNWEARHEVGLVLCVRINRRNLRGQMTCYRGIT
jgi:hypothetical protein